MLPATAPRRQVRRANADEIKPELRTMTTTKRKPRPAVSAAALQQGKAPHTTGAHLVYLSDPELKPAMDRLKQRIATDPAFAHSLLNNAGIVTAKGKLTKRCGG